MSAEAVVTAPDVGRLDVPRPVVVAAAAALAAGMLFRVGAEIDGLAAAGLAAVLVVLSAIDLRERRLPNVIIGPAIVGVLAAHALVSPDRLLEAVVCGLLAAAFLLLPLVVSPGGIGMGDVKLVLLLGCALGTGVVAGLMVAFVAVIPAAAVLFLVHGRAARRATFPLGPFLAAGAIVVMLWQGYGG